MNQIEHELRRQAELRRLGLFPQKKVKEQIIVKVIDLIDLLLEINPSLLVAIHVGAQLIVRLIGSDLSMKEHIDAVRRADSQLQAGLLAASLGLNPDIRGMIMDLHNALKPLLAELSKGAIEGHDNEASN